YQQNRACAKSGPEQACSLTEQPLSKGKREQDGNNRSKEGRKSIRPDLAKLGRFPKRRTCSLEPVNGDRLFIAGFVLEAYLDEVAGFEHLARRLRKPRLVPVYGRKSEKPRNEGKEAKQNKKKIESRSQTASYRGQDPPH